MGAVYPFTSCIRVDSLDALTKKVSLLLKVARWLKRLPPVELP
jgi:hypothetical protein